jgi:hypothetical protein
VAISECLWIEKEMRGGQEEYEERREGKRERVTSSKAWASLVFPSNHPMMNICKVGEV